MAHEHDRFFRHVFGDPANAAGELRAVLPGAITTLLDWSTLRLEESADVDTELRERRTDLLFSARLAGEQAYLLVLIEHKSQVEPLVALDLLAYMLRVWERRRRAHGDAIRLPPILPLVVCHDERRWSAPRSFGDLYAIDAAVLPRLRPYLVDFTYGLDDLVVSEEELRDRAVTTTAKVALFCLKRARVADDMVAELETWIDALREINGAPNGQAIIVSVLTYVLRVSRTPPERIRDVTRALGEKTEDAMMSTLEELIQQGRAEAKADALLTFLRARSLPVSEAERARVFACTDVATLDRWIRRAATAATTAEALADEQ